MISSKFIEQKKDVQNQLNGDTTERLYELENSILNFLNAMSEGMTLGDKKEREK